MHPSLLLNCCSVLLFSLTFDIVREYPFEGINRASVTITPDDGDRIVTLTLHVSWIDVFRHLVDLKNLASVYFINACCTSTFDSQFIWVDGLFYYNFAGTCRGLSLLLVLFDQNFRLYRVILRLKSLNNSTIVNLLNLFVDIDGDIFVYLDNWHLFRQC